MTAGTVEKGREAVLRRLTAAPGPTAVLQLDLDHLSLVNEVHGHQAGDDLLRVVEGRVRRLLAAADDLVHVGGDQYVVVLDDAGSADEVARRVLDAISQPVTLRGATVAVTASAGLVLCPPASPTDALRHAEAATHDAKRRGGAQVRTYDAAVSARAVGLLELATDLRQTLHDGGGALSVHYQPVVDLASDRLVALEALARWRHPEHGVIPPLRFVEAAEHIGISAELDLRTMGQAFRDFVDLDRSRVVAPDVRISVNVAAAHLRDGDAAGLIVAQAHLAGLDPRRIAVEVAEAGVLTDLTATQRSLERLRAQGVLVALDDFGAGSTSLTHLRHLPIDLLKIDRSFVSDVAVGRDDVAVVAALVDLAHALGVAVVAKGVETPEQRHVLADLKCEQAQGYLWSPPVPVEALPDALATTVQRGRAAATLGSLARQRRQAADVVGREHGLLRMLELERSGASPATIAAALNAEGFRTPEGARWHRLTVAKALRSHTSSGASLR